MEVGQNAYFHTPANSYGVIPYSVKAKREMANNSSLASQDSFAYDDFSSNDWYIYEPIDSSGPQDDKLASAVADCNPTIPSSLYHVCMAPISLAILIGLSFLVKRKKLCKGCWSGAPGLLSPVNFLEEEGNQGLVVAVFGILFSSLCVLVLDKDPLPFIPDSSRHNREYWKIMALLYYPAFYYPLIACATVRHRAGYLMGCLLSWCHCVVHIWQKVDCPQSSKIYRYYSLLSYVPVIFCLVVLSLWYPLLLIRSFAKERNAATELAGSGYYKRYLKNILAKKTQRKSSGKVKTSLLSKVQAYLYSYIYTPQEGFQIPLKLVLSVTMAVIAVYQVAVLLLVTFIPTIQIVRAGMTKDVTVLLVQFGVVPSENAGGIPGDMEKELETIKHYLWSLEVCYVCSLVVCFLLTFAMLMRSLVMHRNNLKALYRGAVLDVFYPAQTLRPSQQAVFCWMSFASFQAAFACLGLILQQVIFFICTAGFTFLVVIPLQSGAHMHLFKILQNMWPFCLMLVVAVIVQNLAAHFCFLEKRQLQKELTNRRALYILTYLLFPINVLAGIMAGIWRMVISVLYNAIHFCQLDISLLNRAIEVFDPGYRTYCHYLKIEVSQSHPVMKAFCFLLLQLPSPKGQTRIEPTDVEEGIQLIHTKKLTSRQSQSKQTRARWWLAYTLLKNPSLSACRKAVLSDPIINGTRMSPMKL